MFDDPNLVASAGLVPVMGLAQEAGLEVLARQHLSVPDDKGANAGLKVASLVAGMVAGADSIDDMALLRHGGIGRLFAAVYAPSTMGSFLRAFAFGHVRQLDAVASRFLLALTELTGLGTTKPTQTPADAERSGLAFVDVDDTVIEVHGHAKQGAGFGYTKVRGLNALLDTATTPGTAPVIVAQRLRRETIKKLGGARVGDNTMIDALEAASTALSASAAEDSSLIEALEATAAAALVGAELTSDLVAARGRATYVRELARGVLDPGAVTIALFPCRRDRLWFDVDPPGRTRV
ncbi:DAK2 domain-containing protein [Phycicoccus sp. KQZ13P-1]|nr:DAK2 domain-containing protein [Phycicoccus mangrovi]